MSNYTYNSVGQVVSTNPKTGEIIASYNGADIAWTLASTVFVFIMTPGAGYMYSGMARRKHSLSLIHLSVGTMAVITFQWFFWGFSLAFSDTGSGFIGNLRYICLTKVLENPTMNGSNALVPAIVYCIFQLMFAAVTAILAVGAIAERGRLGPTLVFVFIWSTLVYDPIAYWTWNNNGWAKKLGVLDFAGGTPVHINAGCTALAISFFLGDRPNRDNEKCDIRPHNMTYVVLGTVFMWFGWFGFNGGSALGANLRATNACVVTTLGASVSGIIWMLWDYRNPIQPPAEIPGIPGRKLSLMGFCAGAVSGLVAVTPASGYVPAYAAVIIGITAGTFCYWISKLCKESRRWDDVLDIFSPHVIGGVTGNFLTGIFAKKSIAALDGSSPIRGGAIEKHGVLVPLQLANSVCGGLYALIVTYLILRLMAIHPSLRLDLHCGDSEFQKFGMDEEIGEFAYDYVVYERNADPGFDANGTADGQPDAGSEEAANLHSSGSRAGGQPIPAGQQYRLQPLRSVT